MDQFTYRDGELFCEGVAMAALADDVGTPVYVYSTATIFDHCRRMTEAFAPLEPAGLVSAAVAAAVEAA